MERNESFRYQREVGLLHWGSRKRKQTEIKKRPLRRNEKRTAERLRNR